MANINMHSTHSTLREQIVEHVFVGKPSTTSGAVALPMSKS